MAEKKKIPCRVCGKLFIPCAYCQSNTDTFRWRNFACTIECAKKYIDETNAYRATLNGKGETAAKEKTNINFVKKNAATKEKINKNNSLNVVKSTTEETIKNIKTE